MNDGSYLKAPNAFSESASWRSRGYIPHFDHFGLMQFITLCLEDAVPEAVIEQWKCELGWAKGISANDPRQRILRRKIEKYEDAGYGACWLRNENLAIIVEEAILYHDLKRYRVIAWCIMPNHIHAIIEILKNYSLAVIIHSWKSFTAHRINRILHRSGTFWFREYYDRFIRDSDHLANAVGYVEYNPVKAGLVAVKEEWKWSSAGRRPGSALGAPASRRQS
jgi:putative transposase